MTSVYQQAREQTYRVLNENNRFLLFIGTLIVLNVLAVILESVNSLEMQFRQLFQQFELFSGTVFTIEYLLRLWSIPEQQAYAHPLRGRLRYIVTPMMIIDFVAILPFWLPMLVAIDMRFARALRLLRMFRILKLGRYSKSMQVLGAVIVRKRGELGVTLFSLMVLLTVVSCLMYLAEHEAQPELYADIPSAMWWGIVTLTTIGYGDVFPVTTLGKLLTAVEAILGIGLFALPAGILGSGFLEAMQQQGKPPACPHCGKRIEP